LKYSAEEFWNGHRSLSYMEKVPRKLKKAILGKRISKSKLRRMLAETKIIKMKYPEPAMILPEQFCPNCGCNVSYVEDHGVPYPEIWIDDHCLRCHEVVGGADNSPYYHVLEDMIEPEQSEIR